MRRREAFAFWAWSGVFADRAGDGFAHCRGCQAAAGAAPQSAQPRPGGTLRFGQNVEIAAGGAAGSSPLDAHNISPAPLSAIWLGYDSPARYATRSNRNRCWAVSPSVAAFDVFAGGRHLVDAHPVQEMNAVLTMKVELPMSLSSRR